MSKLADSALSLRSAGTDSVTCRACIVGCSRSGTTVLQKLICETFEVFSVPETGYFLNDVDSFYKRVKSLFRLHFLYKRQVEVPINICVILKEFGKFFCHHIRRFGIAQTARQVTSERECARAWQITLDCEAIKNGYEVWVEKTPKHIFRIKTIREHTDVAFFIIIIRDGVDVVASMRERARRYPLRFAAETLERSADTWNKATKVAAENKDCSDCIFVRYEELVKRPAQVLDEIGRRVGLRRRRQAARSVQIIRADEAWKDAVDGALVNRSRAGLLGSKEVEEIREKIDEKPLAEIDFI